MLQLVPILGATTPRHLVSSLPGYGPTPTKHWTGFVEVDPPTSTHFFYTLVESAGSPSTDPLVWWMNGGPGASSFAGLIGENGPLLLNASGLLTPNPFAWNRHANVLYVEFGPGIGYSYCANSTHAGPDAPCPQSSGACSPCFTSDDLLAAQNAKLLSILLSEIFPELASRPLYLAGESYAGVYIPTLARELLRTSVGQLRGLWVTDPCTDNVAQAGWLDLGVSFAFQKGLIDLETRTALMSSECSSGTTKVGDRVRVLATNACRRAWRLYDLGTAGIGNAVHPPEIPGVPLYIDPLSALGPSGGPDLAGYFNRPDVRAALNATQSPNAAYHLELDNNGYPQYELQYAACNNAAAEGAPSMIDVYKEIMALLAARSRDGGRVDRVALPSAVPASLLTTLPSRRPSPVPGLALRGQSLGSVLPARSGESAPPFQILISSGDIDPVVDLHGTEQAVRAIGLPVAPGEARRPWFYNASGVSASTLVTAPTAWGPSLHAQSAGAQVGGFVTAFATGVPSVGLSFFTFKNSGHMVPAYAPSKSLHVLSRLAIGGQSLAPPLPAGWDDSDSFYSRDGSSPGLFADWVGAAMAPPFL